MNRKDEHVSLAKAFHDKQKNEFDFVRIPLIGKTAISVLIPMVQPCAKPSVCFRRSFI